jgi:hypothetical protein
LAAVSAVIFGSAKLVPAQQAVCSGRPRQGFCWGGVKL